jgi:hypothetical protein
MRSVRVFALLFHFVSIAPLYWTRIDSVQRTSDSEAWKDESEKYVTLISFSLACLFFEAIHLSRDVCVISFTDCVHIILDCIGAFLSLWIAVDGLAWRTYISVATICT